MSTRARALAVIAGAIALSAAPRARADVAAPPRCEKVGDACVHAVGGVMGYRENGTCVASATGLFYCKVGPACFPAHGPGPEHTSPDQVSCAAVIPAPAPTQAPSAAPPSAPRSTSCTCDVPGGAPAPTPGALLAIGALVVGGTRRRPC